jgi:DNA-binding NtrC family response regulator
VVRISDDPSMKPVIRLVLKAAACHANVLLFGESGVGKTYIARRIHDSSPLALAEFYTFFCLPDGDRRQDAGYLTDRLEAMELEAGTIYVRDIDILSPLGQRKMLSYLDDRERRIKSSGPSDRGYVRLIFSSEKDLRLESAAGRYLRQLYLRTSVITIEVPPLRQREADIISLARHFLNLYSDRECKAIRRLSNDAEYILRGLSWEGNINELKNAMNRAVVLADDVEVLSAGTLRGVIRLASW